MRTQNVNRLKFTTYYINLKYVMMKSVKVSRITFNNIYTMVECLIILLARHKTTHKTTLKMQ